MQKLYLTNEIVDFFALEHDRTSCSDKNRVNVNRCLRCRLLFEQWRDGFILSDDISIFFNNKACVETF